MSKKVRSKRLLALSAAVAGIGSMFTGHAYGATTLTWNANGGGALTDGSGSWGTTTPNNWGTATLGSPWAAGNVAAFGAGGTAGTVTVGNVTAAGLTFNSLSGSSYTLTGGTITLTATPVVVNNNAIINSALAGTLGITETGTSTSTLTVGGANTFTGGFTLTSGNLLLGASNGIGTANLFTQAASTVFDLGGFNQTVTGLAVTSPSTITASSGNSTLTVNDPGTTYTDGGVLSGSGLTVIKTGNGGDLKLGNGAADTLANTFAGGLFVGQGTVELNKSASVSSAGTGTITVGDGTANVAKLQLDAANQTSSSNAIVINANGTFAAGNNNDTIGAVNMTNGSITIGTATLTLGGDVTATSSSAAGVATISGGTLNLGSVAARTFTVSRGSNTAAPPDDMLISSNVQGTASISKAGGGILELNTSSTYSGGTNINGGTLWLATNAFAAGTGSISVNSGATLVDGITGIANPLFLNGGTLQANSGNMTPSGSVTIQSNSTVTLADYTTAATVRNFTFSGALLGSGNLALVNPDAAGTVIFNNTATSSNYSGTITLGSSVTLQAYATGTLGTQDAIGNGVVVINSDAVGSPILQLRSDTSSLFTNAVTINNVGAASIDVNRIGATSTGNTLTLNSVGIGTTAGNQTFTVSGGNTYNLAISTLTLNAAEVINTTSANLVVSNIVGGSNNITKVGANILNLATTNAVLSGNITATAGTVQASANGVIGTGSTVTVNGGTLDLATNNTGDTFSNLNISSGSFKTGTGNVNISTGLTATGGSFVIGVSTLTLGADANGNAINLTGGAFTGSTVSTATISTGTSYILLNGNINVSNTANAASTIGSNETGSGTFRDIIDLGISGGTRTISVAAAVASPQLLTPSLILQGRIAGSGTIVKTGAGELSFADGSAASSTDTDTFTGNLLIKQGQVDLGNNITGSPTHALPGLVSITIGDSGTNQNAGLQTFGSNNGSFSPYNNYVVTAAANTATNSLITSLGGAGNAGTGTSNLTMNLTNTASNLQLVDFSISGSWGATYSGFWSGAGGITKVGNNDVTISGTTNSFTGGIVVLDNTLKIASFGTLGVAGANDIVIGDSSNPVTGGVNANAGGTVTVAGVNISGAITTNRNVTIQSGATNVIKILSSSNGGTFANDTVTLNDTFAVSEFGGTNLILNGQVSGTGGVTIVGTGVTYGGSNNYTGGTFIAALDTLTATSANAFAGSGPIVAESGGTLKLNINQATTPSVTVASNAASGLGILRLEGNFSVNLDPTSSGVLAIDSSGTNSYTSNILGPTSAFLGSVSGGTYGGTTLTAQSGGIYRLGGGGGALTITNSVVSGSNNLQVGSVFISNGGGTVILTNSNSLSGTITVSNAPNLLTSTTLEGSDLASGSPFGSSTNNVNLIGGILQLDRGAANVPTVTLGTLTVEGTGGVRLNTSVGTAGNLTFADIARTNHAVVDISGATGTASLATGASILITNSSNPDLAVTNNMLNPVYQYVTGFIANGGADFATYSSTGGFSQVLAANETVVTSSISSQTTTTSIASVNVNIAENGTPTVYALKFGTTASSALSGTGTVTVLSGGIIFDSNWTVAPGIALGTGESVITAYSGNTTGDTLNGVLSGGGSTASITKTGQRGLTLGNATNSYTGTWVIEEGRLQLGASGTTVGVDGMLGYVNNNVILDGGMLVDDGAAGDHLTMAATRTLTIGAQGGELGTANAANSNAGDVWQGPVNGSGLLSVLRNGGNAVNTYWSLTGSEASFTGTIAVNSTGGLSGINILPTSPGSWNSAIGLSAAAGGVINTNSQVSTLSSLAMDGTANISVQNLTISQLSGAGSGLLKYGVAATQSTLTIGDSTNQNYYGVIAPIGTATLSLAKTGSGKEALWGISTIGGGTSIGQGTLAVNGTLTSNVNVGSTGVLGGSGTIIGSVLVQNGGHVGPGNSPGTLNTTGNATVSLGGNLDYDLSSVNTTAGSNINDLWNITGNLDFTTAGTLNITTYGSTANNLKVGTYDLINYTGSLLTASTGTLSSWALPTFVGEALSLVASNNQIDLLVTSNINASSLSLSPSTLTYNTHVGVAGPGVNGTLANITSTGDSGSFTLASTGSSLTVNPSAGTVAASGTTTVNLGWGNVSSAGARSSTLSVTNNSASVPDTSNHTLTISGGVYNFATGSVGTSVTLADSFVGNTSTATIGVSNVSPSGLFSEGLDANFTSSSGVTTSGSISLLTAGSSSNNLKITSNSGSAHTGGGNAVIGLVSDGSGTSNLGTTSVGSATVSVTGGNVYDHAVLVDPPVVIRLTQGTTGSNTYSLSDPVNGSGLRDGAAISGVVADTNFGTSFTAPATLSAGSTNIYSASYTSTVGGATAGNLTFTYGDVHNTLAGANNNNQTLSVGVNAQVDPIVEHVGDTSGIDLSTRALIGTASPTYITTGQYYLGTLNQQQMAGGTGHAAGTVQINVLPSGNTVALLPESILLFDFGNGGSFSSAGFSSLTSDLTAFGYSYSTDTNSGALGAFDHSPFQPTSFSYELSVTINPSPVNNPSYADFNFSKYGLQVDNFAAVPEPTTVGLLGAAGMGLLARRRRKSSSQARKA